MTTDWKWNTTGSMQEYGRFVSQGRGCSSLHDMATRNCLYNSYDITAETLEEVPEAVGVALWRSIIVACVLVSLRPPTELLLSYRCNSQLDNVPIFLAFSKAYPSLIARRYQAILRPQLPLPCYLQGVKSFDHQWLTQLTLLDITVPRTALIQLSLIPNLSVVTIGPGVLATDIGVDDSLLRTWSRAASTGAFSMLRALVLRDQPYVTTRAFSYLNVFKALAIFATESMPHVGARDKPTALAHGWKYKTRQDLSDWLMTGGGANSAVWDEISHALFKLAGQLNDDIMTTKDVEGVAALPTLHLAVGGHAGKALIDVAGKEAMRVWYRSGKIAASEIEKEETQLPLPDWSSGSISSSAVKKEEEAQGSTAAPSTQTVPSQKRAQDSQGRSSDMAKRNPKRTTPVIRASKRQDLDDLLLDFAK